MNINNSAPSGPVTGNKTGFRLRLGVLLLLMWFLPFWLLSPYIASLIDPADEESLTFTITVVIMTVQTLIGLVGAYLAGKETAGIIRNTPRKHMLATAWRIFRHGNSPG
ncbi:MAG: hypothetical protein ACYC6O_02200 [Thermoleophilia bacterium]